MPPTEVIEDDATGDVEIGGIFDPATDGIDFYESLEGMQVQVNDAVAVGPTNDFGEIAVLADDGEGAGVRSARGGIVVRPGDFNPERIILDDVLAPMRAVLAGWRITFEDRAKAFDVAPPDATTEARRKTRTLAGNVQILWLEPRLLIPFVNPVWLQYVSHKVGRLLVPYALIALLVASAVLAAEQWIYAAALAGQLAFYALAAYGAWLAHRAEADLMERPSRTGTLADIYVTDALFAALPPVPGWSADRYEVEPAPATRLVDEGDVIDLGDRHFEVLHLPGHSPGSIGLWEERTGILFSGDAIYDGELIDDAYHSNLDDYIRTMRRLRDYPATVVHGGHYPSFGRERLRALAQAFLESKDAA